jgi:outer membrane protein assembly factor BamB
MMGASTARRWWTTRHVARSSAVAAVAVVALVAAPQAAVASVSSTADNTPNVNGPVYAIVRVGDLTVIGGSFSKVGRVDRQNIAALRPDGTLDPDFTPEVNGTVRALAASADGTRVFVGGLFTSAGGAARANLAAVDADTGAAVAGWQADTVGDGPEVYGLAVSGSRLYVGGRYSGIDGSQRRRLAAVDTGTGDVITTFRPSPNGVVKAVRVSPDATKVYAGGSFTEIGGQVRLHSTAEVLASTGDATAFNPSQGGGKVVTIGLIPTGGRVFFATENNTLFAYDVTSATPAWEVKTSGNTQAIAVSPTEIYIGGHFSQIQTSNNAKRNLIASLHPATGQATAWNPIMDGRNKGVWAIEMSPAHLLVGGGFITVNGAKLKGFARFAGTP